MNDEQEPLQPEEEEHANLEQLTAETALRKAQLEAELLGEQLKKAKRENKSAPYRWVGQVMFGVLIVLATTFFLYQPLVDTVREVTKKEGVVATLEAKHAALQADIQAAENQKLSQQLTVKDAALEERDRQLRVQEADYKNRLEHLAQDLKDIQTQKEQALALTEGLRSELKGLQEEYERFAQTSETEKEKFRQLAAQAQERAKQLAAQVTSLKAQARTAEEQARQVQQQVETLPGRVFHDPLKTGGLGPEMIIIPAGSFVMGSPPTEPRRVSNEGPQHPVTISRPFTLSVCEITFADYDAFVQNTKRQLPDDEGWGRGNRPVINVSWNDARAYAAWLSKQTGQHYRLPTEAEWEYAARAGTTTAFSFGGNPAQLREYAWYRDNANNQTHPVGQLKPNAWGLYDMHGNVTEMVHDWYNKDYYQNSTTLGPQGPAEGRYRVLRGGSWDGDTRDVRSARRHADFQGAPFPFIGFRLVRELASDK